MHVGASMFFTDYSMPAADLARALEERGFESVWAPEHSHIPLSRRTPWGGGGDLLKKEAEYSRRPPRRTYDPGPWRPGSHPCSTHWRCPSSA